MINGRMINGQVISGRNGQRQVTNRWTINGHNIITINGHMINKRSINEQTINARTITGREQTRRSNLTKRTTALTGRWQHRALDGDARQPPRAALLVPAALGAHAVQVGVVGAAAEARLQPLDDRRQPQHLAPWFAKLSTFEDDDTGRI